MEGNSIDKNQEIFSTQGKKIKSRKTYLALIVLMLVAVTGIGIYIVSARLSSKQAVAPTAPVSEPRASCNIGSRSCQEGPDGGNTGYRCTCTASREWSCGEYNTNRCPVGVSDDPTNAVTCTAINGTRYNNGEGVCTTLNGLRNGNYCTCTDTGGVGTTGTDTGAWRCVVDGGLCSIQVADVRVIAANAATNCTGANAVNATTGCVSAPAGATINQYSCPNQSQLNTVSSGCQENGTRVSGSTACMQVSCGSHQIDIISSAGTCFYSTYIPCSTPTPTTRITTTTTPTITITTTITTTPTNTPTTTPTITITTTTTPTETPTSTPTLTPIETPTSTPTDSPTETPTQTPTKTPTETSTPIPTQIAQATPKPTKLPDAGILDIFGVLSFGGGLLLAVVGVLLAL